MPHDEIHDKNRHHDEIDASKHNRHCDKIHDKKIKLNIKAHANPFHGETNIYNHNN